MSDGPPLAETQLGPLESATPSCPSPEVPPFASGELAGFGSAAFRLLVAENQSVLTDRPAVRRIREEEVVNEVT